MWPSLIVPGEPMKAAVGDVGLCPKCECGGRERPCWYCGNDKGFTMGIGHLINPFQRP